LIEIEGILYALKGVACIVLWLASFSSDTWARIYEIFSINKSLCDELGSLHEGLEISNFLAISTSI